MHTIIIIDKNSNLTQRQVKSFDKLYTSCNYRNSNNFELIHSWTKNQNTYELHGKKNKKLNNENTYIFKDISNIFYGNLCIIKKINDEPSDLTINEWSEFNGENVEEDEIVEEQYIPYTVSDDKELVHEEYESE